MALLGRSEPEKLLSGLDPRLLVRLVRDLMLVRGHANVRETDGPGDSTRDVYSEHETRGPHLAQCKHHESTDAVCRARDVAELPLALFKHGYKHGLFVTNGRITAPAKKELLDNYPGMVLEFLDGAELAAEVLGSDLLRSLWVDDDHITLCNRRAIFPVLCRKHALDTPVVLSGRAVSKTAHCIVAEIAEKLDGVELLVETAWGVPLDPFSPYRPPAQPVLEEGRHEGITTMNVVATGKLGVDGLATIGTQLAKRLAEALSPELGGITVVAGRPYLTGLNETWVRGGTLTSMARQVFVGTRGRALEEERWFLELPENWSSECDARTTETAHVRLFCETQQIAASFEVETLPTPFQQYHTLLRKIAWENSMFALVPSGMEVGADLSVDWIRGGRKIVAWSHQGFVDKSGWMLEPRSSIAEGGSSEIDRDAPDPRFSQLREQFSGQPEVEMLTPRDARHMFALVGSDPYGDDIRYTADTAQLVGDFDSISSPLNPHGRCFEFTVAWHVPIDWPGERNVPSSFDTGSIRREGSYCVAEWREDDVNLSMPTAEVLAKLQPRLQARLEEVEAKMDLRERSTARYWLETRSVRLGVSWRDSEKQYVWFFRPVEPEAR